MCLCVCVCLCVGLPTLHMCAHVCLGLLLSLCACFLLNMHVLLLVELVSVCACLCERASSIHSFSCQRMFSKGLAPTHLTTPSKVSFLLSSLRSAYCHSAAKQILLFLFFHSFYSSMFHYCCLAFPWPHYMSIALLFFLVSFFSPNISVQSFYKWWH